MENSLNEKEGTKPWKAHISSVLNEENKWDQIADAYTV